MDHAAQVRLMERVFGFLDARSTELGAAPFANDVATYTSPEQLARERELLFGREPLFVGLSSEVPGPGTYLAHRDAGVPLLIVRGRDGELRAFVGLCRHRGAQLLEDGAGSHPGRFTCPYHGWTYDERGRLIAQPCADGFAGIDRETLALTRLPVAERHGMIFVRTRPGEPIDVDAHLAGAADELRALDLAGHHRFARRELAAALNWKLAVDTFLEAYHVTSLHERSLGAKIDGATAAWDAFGRGGRLVAVRRSIASARARPRSEWNLFEHSVVLYQLFPNTILIYQVDHVEVVQAYPGASPDAATVVFTLYTPGAAVDERARRHFQANFDLLLDVSEKEDFRIAAGMQRGFHVAGHPPVIYGRNEPGLAHYHRMIRAALDA
jgi:phenylpropionate dioxygenase-like ring-hydroxylating dioxygenase large terminal subunit